jgi:quinol monooxygenase YgiN
MSLPSNVVSIHPYFKVHPGKLDEFKTLMRAFVAKTESEEGNLYYEFTINDGVVFCREGYVGAEGALAHLTNVGDLIAEALKISDVLRLELHGPAEELEKMKAPMAAMNPAMFALEWGVRR